MMGLLPGGVENWRAPWRQINTVFNALCVCEDCRQRQNNGEKKSTFSVASLPFPTGLQNEFMKYVNNQMIDK